MQSSSLGTALVLLAVALAHSAVAAAPPGDAPATGVTWPDLPFVIGAPGRPRAVGDRRQRRRPAAGSKAVGAYADIEQVEDGAWLQHELEGYVRGAVDCTGLAPLWCRREVRRLGAARVLFFAAGMHAELVWMCGGGTAVRLGWQRIIGTPTGTMTLDDPPADFATALLAEFPSSLDAFELDAARDAVWAAGEAERLRYYGELDSARPPWCDATAPSLSLALPE